MKYRKLRIAWSVAWGVVAVLLCVLWVRSYSWSNTLISSHWNGVIVISNGQVFYDAYFNISWASPEQAQVSHFWYGSYWYQIQNIWNPDTAQIYRCKWRLPIWPLAVCAFAAMTLPWLFRLRRGFSLRTLLIATTLIARALGLIVWAAT